MRVTPFISRDEALALPVDQLALRLLRRGDDTGSLHRHNLLTVLQQAYDAEGYHDNEPALRAVAEAFDWLTNNGLISKRPLYNDNQCFVTRRGRRVLESNDGLAVLRAEDRLSVDLHPRLNERVRAQFFLGEYELAAFAAMREVEIRVRELAEVGDSEIGVRLMQSAFGKSGPLRDGSLDPGEQEATMALFWGAIGVFKNPSSHRPVQYADATEAAEVIMFADLLLRMLDRTTGRLNARTT